MQDACMVMYPIRVFFYTASGLIYLDFCWSLKDVEDD